MESRGPPKEFMFDKPYILTVDVGSGSGKVVVFDDNGHEVSFAQREWLPKVLPRHPGSQVFDTQETWGILAACIREALEKGRVHPSRIRGVSSSSMREGMVLYDRNRREIWACPNIDARAREEVEEMLALGIAEKVYHIGGDWLNIISPPRFAWIKKHQPDIFKQVSYMSMISDWVLFKLCGNLVTDPTVGSSSGMFDLRSRNWSAALIEMCHLPRHIYPPVHEPATEIGTVSKEAAESTGLKEGTPVITGGADTQLALLGTGNYKPGDWALVGGTFWQTALIWDSPLIDPFYRPRTLCHVSPDRWMTEGIGFLIGQQARWLRDAFCQEEVRYANEHVLDPYSVMEELGAKAPPGSNGVMGLFSDIHNSKSWKHASPSFVNFDIYNPHTSGKAECIRALWESAAYVAYGNLLVLEEISGTTPKEVTFCGGASKGFLWPQIVAHVFGVPVRVPIVKEATSLGCAMCVGIGTGLFKDYGQAVERWVHTERIFAPDARLHGVYLEHFTRWRAVFAKFMDIVNDGLLTPMWRAPGT
jgi:autoinducer 2 (AI-2) kinase